MIKIIGIVIIFFGILMLLGGLNNSPNGMGFDFLLGVMLTIIGALIFLYDPVEDMKNRVMKRVEGVIPPNASAEQVRAKIEEARKEVEQTTADTTTDAKKKINQLAKEVEKLTQ